MALRRAAAASCGSVVAAAAYKRQTDPLHIFWDLDHTLLCSVSPIPAGDARGSYFDQIDDDFPYEGSAPNTRTFWRPGARAALAACGVFATQHVFTAAQDTYTANIMRELDGSAFATVTTRDGVPSCVKRGKDLSLVVDRADRSLLFDDRAKNFRPQRGRNGVLVKPYDRAATSDAAEMLEMARCVGIAFLALLAPDARDVVDAARREA